MPFDIIGAKQAGFSDDEIAQEMASKYGFDYAGAKNAGFSTAEILGELSSKSDIGTGEQNPVGFIDRVNQDLSERGQNVKNMVARNAPDLATGLWRAPKIAALAAGQAAGVINDIALEGAKSAYSSLVPASVQNAISNGASYLASTQPGQAVMSGVGKASEAYKGFSDANPDAAMALSGAANMVGAIPLLKGAGAVAEAGGKAVTSAGAGVANIIGDLGTHTGGRTIKDAAKAGFAGGAKDASFVANMRGTKDIGDTLVDFKNALGNMRTQRAADYRSGMFDISQDKAVLDFKPIEQAVDDTTKIGTYKGKIVNRSAAETQQKITDIVDEWKVADPAEFHTPEGLDALKRTLGDLRDSTDIGTPSRKIADTVYHAVKEQITKQAPKYAEVMSNYEQASKTIQEIEKAFSANDKSSADTAIRKLQSLTRNNVSTNYGNRVALAQDLEQYGYPNLLSDLSGQALNTWQPRGIGKLIAGGTAAGGVMTANPAAIPLLAVQSPRLMGEAARMVGKGAGVVRRLLP